MHEAPQMLSLAVVKCPEPYLHKPNRDLDLQTLGRNGAQKENKYIYIYILSDVEDFG